MSQQGVRLAAKILSQMQQARLDLIELGTRPEMVGTKSGNQDIKLGQLFETAKEAIKDRFASIVSEDVADV